MIFNKYISLKAAEGCRHRSRTKLRLRPSGISQHYRNGCPASLSHGGGPQAPLPGTQATSAAPRDGVTVPRAEEQDGTAEDRGMFSDGCITGK